MLGYPEVPTSYENAVNNLFIANSNVMFTLLDKTWKDEDIYGDSCAFYRISDYYTAYYLVSLIYRDIEEQVVTNWDEVLEKYNLVALSECYACKGINLTEVFEEFGFPFIDCSCGIECMGFQVSFEIEPDCNPCSGCGENGEDTSTYVIKDLLDNLSSCTNTLSE